MAARAEAKHLVLSHIVWGMGGGVDDITADASRDFRGRLTLGADLQAFAV